MYVLVEFLEEECGRARTLRARKAADVRVWRGLLLRQTGFSFVTRDFLVFASANYQFVLTSVRTRSVFINR